MNLNKVLLQLIRLPCHDPFEVFGIRHDPAVADVHDALRVLGRGSLMSDENDGMTLVVECLQRLHDGHSRSGIQVSCGFIGEDHVRIRHQRTRDGDALLLTAGQLAGEVVPAIGETDEFDGFQRSLLALCSRNRRMIKERQHHVLPDRRAWQQVEGLEDEADACGTDAREIVIVERRRRLSLKKVLSFGMQIQKSEDVHERGLSGTGRTHDGDEFSAVDPQVDVIQHGRDDTVVVVRLAEIDGLDEGRLHDG